MRFYSVIEGTWTSFPFVLTDGQVDRRKVPNVLTMVKDLHLSEVAPRNLEEGALPSHGRSVKPDGVEKRRFRTPGLAPLVCLIVRDTRRTLARHVILTKGTALNAEQRPSTRCFTPFQQGGRR